MSWASLANLGRARLFCDGDWVESKDQDPLGTVRLTQLADIGQGAFRNRSDRWMREDQAARLNCTFLEPNDVLIARMPDPIGRACLVPHTLGRAVTAVDVAILRVDQERVLPAFAMWMINAPQFHERAEALQSGTTRKRISRKNLATLEIPIFPLNEQRRIVEILEDHLSRLDAAAGYDATARRRVTALRRSSLQSHFGIESGGVPLNNLIADISAGKSFGSSAAPASPDEWGIIKVSAMTWGNFDPTQNKAVPADRVDRRYEIRTGDLLVSRANTSEYVGASVMVGYTRPRLLLSDKSLRITPRLGVSSEWLWRSLQAPSARRQISKLATGTKDSMRNISQGSLRSVLVPVADMEDQRRSVAAYAEVDLASRRLSGQLEAQTRRSCALRSAVLAAAFEGKLTGRHTDAEVIEEMADV